MQDSESVLCLHQGSELYGSDRSFLSAVQALSEGSQKVDVILPVDGELAAEFRKIPGLGLSFYDKGILRKRELLRPFSFVWQLVLGVLFYLRTFSAHRIIYINTVVMFSALVAACFYRFSSQRIICHVREIPGRAQLLLFRMLFRLAGVELIYNSEATREAFGMAGQVIYNGVTAVRALSPEESSIGVDEPLRLLLIGRINQWKGQDFFIEALGTLTMEQLQRTRVRIVGSPFEGYEYLLDTLAARIEALGLEDIIEMVPFCPDPSAHYQWADYVVVPSTNPEPFGRVAIEAFSFGTPVIAAAHGGLLEIVESGKSGLLFSAASVPELAQALVDAFEMPADDYAQLSQNALKRFESKFSLAIYKAQIRALFFDEL
ncbi:glycosyltransferase family 4 protein [Oceanisphaera pacifica]|uniref:Glycosyltransferase family 4 protein n=1 Tax=Oceanisphaera pacifica TaxID=2818389 RepID=A0ABS3NGM7_9GAMM|nr:glycosyltransferase family 4 protein [Oceanisphaera pacifica]MBO1519749.1 glycosyltransferase family 4 protein [Oceanisphaera pacifica]